MEKFQRPDFFPLGSKVPAGVGSSPEGKPADQRKAPRGPKPDDTEPEPADSGTSWLCKAMFGAHLWCQMNREWDWAVLTYYFF